MLEIKNIFKTYKLKNHHVDALQDININIDDGNMIAIVGQSGSGKTSLMNILGALDSDFKGDVIIDNVSLKKAKTKEIDHYRKDKIGFIFQHFTLINSLNARENIELAFDISNTKKSIKKARSQELLELVGLKEHQKKKVNVLSGGQKQRVAIARALANDPTILLADEPTGALDHKTGQQIMQLLKKVAQKHIVVLVTHDMDLAYQYANRIVYLEDGKVVNVQNNIPKVVDGIDLNTKTNITKSNMKFFTALKLAYRNLLLKKGRTIGTALGMSIGIIGISLALALNMGTKKAVNDQVLSIFPANKIFASVPSNFEMNSKDYQLLTYDDYLKVKNIAKDANGVYFPSMNMIFSIMSLNKDDTDYTEYMKKVQEGKETSAVALISTSNINLAYSTTSEIGYGKLPSKDKPFDIMISLTTAKDILDKNDTNVANLIGKKVYLAATDSQDKKNATIEFTITGITRDSTLMPTIYVNDNFVSSALEKYFDMSIKDSKTDGFIVFYNNTKNVDNYVKELNDSQKEYKFQGAAQTIISMVNSILDIIRNGLIAFSSISVFVAILMIAIVVYISVLERKQEIGILRAMGAKTKDIRNIFLNEALCIGLLSGCIGVVISLGLCQVINKAITNTLKTMSSNVPDLTIAQLDVKTIIIIIACCGLLSVIAGVIPSIKAAHLDPIDAIRKK
ncbi:MAG: ATP-binding cassette domain-containing protein [Bacilli bacterium]|jgi:ABC-type lipoprotein export system ATPase subunit/ABC-type antimicrobial peptide transport system permease subunit|nr:ATP-binding cassette domain-containing protein [Bacilli bacterium]